MTLDLQNKWVLVTGASSGLGKEMAIQLAKNNNANLILIARRLENLEQIKNEIEAKYLVQVSIFKADLSLESETKTVFESIVSQFELSAVILNAGVTHFGRHLEIAETDRKNILNTNVLNTLYSIEFWANYFEKKNISSALMIISSMGAYHPVPYQALYSGSKGFVFNFAFALSYEIKNPHFSITLYTPSGIETEMTQSEKFDSLKNWMMPVDTAAREAIYAMTHRKRVYIPGFFNRIGNFFMNFAPKTLIGAQMAKLYRKSLEK
jgi:short-subunit dehydrogenase